MEVRMEWTDGLGRTAQVWVDGHLLTVCDGLSAPDRRCPPGVLEGVQFGYVTHEGFSWDQAARGNPAGRKRLDPGRGWAYTGYGQVVSVMPVTIDFGLLVMEDANWSTDERLVGRFVRVAIDRLEIRRAAAPDWPAEAR
mgnify:CR=1 FL=1